MTASRTWLVFFGLALALGVPAYGIVQKERLLSGGTTVLVELAPVDPRSLIQGDYMRLDYAIAREIGRDRGWPRDGQIVVTLGDDSVASLVRRHESGTPLRPGERLLRYRARNGALRIGTDAYYFQEGRARRYERARYGELRVDDSGNSVLVGLRDENRRPM
jgi:uncharacterized membrane-anchored protein